MKRSIINRNIFLIIKIWIMVFLALGQFLGATQPVLAKAKTNRLSADGQTLAAFRPMLDSSNIIISGNAGVAGANLIYTGGLTTADESGNYSITVSSGWSGTVTPIKTGYIFAPGQQNYTNLTTDQAEQNFIASPVIFTNPSKPGATDLISLDSSGQQANLRSGLSALSANGRFIAFTSSATNLVPNDTNGRDDIFLRDLQFGTTTRISVATDGTQANADSNYPVISADGRFVAFSSRAINLASGDSNTSNDIFLHDNQLGTTIRVSVPVRAWDVGDSNATAISADGRYVAFQSYNNSLVPNYLGMSAEIYVRDVWLGVTSLASIAQGGSWSNGTSSFPAFSADGRYLVFGSAATNLVSGDTNAKYDLFMRDMQLGSTTRVSLTSTGEQSNGDSGGFSSISSDGRFVAFASIASNLVPGDTNAAYDIFVRDNQLGTTTRISVDSNGTQSNEPPDSMPILAMSGDGRYIAFDSQATNLVPGDTNTGYDVFLRDTQQGTTRRISVASDGTQANGTSDALPFSLSADGRYIIFFSQATNLATYDSNAAPDIFLHENSYSISGNAGVAGVTINYTDGSTTTDSGGNYSFIAPFGWTGSITPSKTGYTFSPSSINIVIPVTENLSNQDFSAALPTYIISGALGTTGAAVNFSGTTSGSAIVSDLSYSFTVPYGWTGTITPSKAGYTFAPISITISAPGITANLPDQNFTPVINTYTVSGALGVTGAGVAFSGTTSGSATISGSGYSFTVPYGWTGTITPSKPGYTFTPASITISAPDVTADLPNQNFTSAINTYTVSGSLGISGATATFNGTTSGSATISGSSYSFTVPYGWTGTITPSKTGYSFTPTSIIISTPGVTANLSNQNFAAKAVTTYTVSGSVGSKGAGAVITYTGGSTTASSNGSYSFKVPSGWTGTITPSKPGYIFSPVSISITKPVTANLTNQNFTARQVK